MPNDTLTLDLDFTTPEPPITCPADYFVPNIDEAWLRRMAEAEDKYVVSAGITPNGLIAEVLAGSMTEDEAPDLGEKAGILHPLTKRPELDANMYAFVAQARHHGHTDPSLTPVRVSAAGRREFDVLELSRFANELLRGVRSDRPAMTPERWAEASAKARETGGKA